VQVSEKHSIAVTGAFGDPIERWLSGEKVLESANVRDAIKVAPTRPSVLRREISIFAPIYSVTKFWSESRIRKESGSFVSKKKNQKDFFNPGQWRVKIPAQE
jgi:hypothetical protein